MENRRKLILIWASAVVILAVVFWTFSKGENHFVWSETYAEKGNQPYDLGLFREVLEASRGEDFVVLEGLFSDTSYLESTGNTLLLVDGYALIDSSEGAMLRRFTERGNTAFISANTAGSILKRIADCDSDTLAMKLGAEEIRVVGKTDPFELSFDRYGEPAVYSWTCFSTPLCGEAAAWVEVDGERHVNLVKVKSGKGELIIHSTPLIFTNYHFRRREVFEYVTELLPDFQAGKLYYYEPSFSPFSPSEPLISESPLRFILANEPLRWAWYLILLSSFLFVLNGMRRKQRAIPILALPKNQTTAFIDMVYRLYRKEAKHRDVVKMQSRQLRLFLRNKYGLHTDQADFLPEASRKLKMNPSYLSEFFKELDRCLHNSTLDDGDLMKIDRKITEFYLQCP
jgi:hypothetical protein